MTVTPLAMSDSKAAMLERLGLSGPHGEQIYRMLLDEASAGRDRLSYDGDNLTVQSTRTATVQAPYKWDELSETARHREILVIVQTAGQYTRPYYQVGQYRTTVAAENWVAKWFLWHSFRYRDNRPRALADAAQSGNGGNPYYDPVHGVYRR